LPDGPRRPAHWSRPGEEGWIPWFDRTVTFEIHGEVVPEPVTGAALLTLLAIAAKFRIGRRRP
ncbi:MAG: PEP-CTERM sorting domain-containing protein, partial [Armatimonadota bacterium]